MSKMIVSNGQEANAATPARKGELKMAFLKKISQVERLEDGDYTVFKAEMADGSAMELHFVEGGTIEQADLVVIDKIGRRTHWGKTQQAQPISLRKYGDVFKGSKNLTRYRVQKNGTQILFNELIWQLDRIEKGLPIEFGEYNHWLPRASELPELIGVNVGDVVPYIENKTHKDLVLKIFRDTGHWVSVPTYHSQAYALLGNKKITEKDLIQLGYIDRGFYLEIPPDDTYRWCVSVDYALGSIAIEPVHRDTRFAEVFGPHGSIPWEFNSFKEAEVKAQELRLDLLADPCAVPDNIWISRGYEIQ